MKLPGHDLEIEIVGCTSELGGIPTTSAHIHPYQSISCIVQIIRKKRDCFGLKLCARHE